MVTRARTLPRPAPRPRRVRRAARHQRRGRSVGERGPQGRGCPPGARRAHRLVPGRRAVERRPARRHRQDRAARVAERHHRRDGHPGAHRLPPPRPQPRARPGAAAREAGRHGVGRRQRALPSHELPGVERRRRDRGGQRHPRARARRCSTSATRPATTATRSWRRWRPPAANSGSTADIDWRHSGEPFLTEPGRLIEAVGDAVESVAGYRPELSTAGGTSDGRFVAPTGAEVVELGPVNATIHSIDERVLAADLDRLSEMYERVIGAAAQRLIPSAGTAGAGVSRSPFAIPLGADALPRLDPWRSTSDSRLRPAVRPAFGDGDHRESGNPRHSVERDSRGAFASAEGGSGGDGGSAGFTPSRHPPPPPRASRPRTDPSRRRARRR